MKPKNERLEDHFTVSVTLDIGHAVRRMAWDEHVSPGTLVRILMMEAMRERDRKKKKAGAA
jgi:hypothetical protein